MNIRYTQLTMAALLVLSLGVFSGCEICQYLISGAFVILGLSSLYQVHTTLETA